MAHLAPAGRGVVTLPLASLLTAPAGRGLQFAGRASPDHRHLSPGLTAPPGSSRADTAVSCWHGWTRVWFVGQWLRNRLNVGFDPAPVDLVHGPGDIGSLLRGQEGPQVTELDRPTEAAQGDGRGRSDLRFDRLVDLLGAPRQAAEDAGREERARKHKVDGDAILGEPG